MPSTLTPKQKTKWKLVALAMVIGAGLLILAGVKGADMPDFWVGVLVTFGLVGFFGGIFMLVAGTKV